jgi:hypothetical protein
MSWVTRQFDTRTIVLIPIAIAINIVLGQTVAAALKVPIYLDSIGTIFVGAIAGPIPGMVTGLLANLVWQFILPPPFHSDFAGPYAVVAAEIGLLAGFFGARGFFRSRPNASPTSLAVGGAIAGVIIFVIVIYGVLPFYTGGSFTFFGDTSKTPTFFVGVAYLIGIGLVVMSIGFFFLLFVKRDLGVAYIVVAGVTCGVISAFISAPITAALGGVTGSGTDALVFAFQKAGSDLQQAVLQQGLLSDPIDKTITYFIVFLLLQTLSRRFIARFPQGEKAIGLAEDAA